MLSVQDLPVVVVIVDGQDVRHLVTSGQEDTFSLLPEEQREIWQLRLKLLHDIFFVFSFLK